ncbi:MAG: ZIP family metal transporter [Candidatus Pacebacteria bacterium]|nr:ZIP family metal transporter [Candidatus Paceibacterota bacterium]
MTPLISSLLAVGVMSLVSLIGAATLSLKERLLRRALFLLISLAAGALLGDAFIHLLPEAFEEIAPLTVSILVLVGFLSFFVLEKFLHWHHSHGDDEFSPEHARIHPVGHLVLVSDGVHNLIDGLAIGAAFLVSPEVGIATTIAIVLHEIPQEIGDFGLLIHAGYSRAKALFLNFLSALFAFVGVGLAFWLSNAAEGAAPLIAAFAAGNFIYIAAADLIPELHKTTAPWQSVLQFATIVLGLIAMVLLLGLE